MAKWHCGITGEPLSGKDDAPGCPHCSPDSGQCEYPETEGSGSGSSGGSSGGGRVYRFSDSSVRGARAELPEGEREEPAMERAEEHRPKEPGDETAELVIPSHEVVWNFSEDEEHPAERIDLVDLPEAAEVTLATAGEFEGVDVRIEPSAVIEIGDGSETAQASIEIAGEHTPPLLDLRRRKNPKKVDVTYGGLGLPGLPDTIEPIPGQVIEPPELPELPDPGEPGPPG